MNLQRNNRRNNRRNNQRNQHLSGKHCQKALKIKEVEQPLKIKKMTQRIAPLITEPSYQPPDAQHICATLLYQRQAAAMQRHVAMMAPYEAMFAQEARSSKER